MKITGIETIPVRVPIQENLAIRAKGGYHSVSPFLLVRMHTDEGIVGLGEVSCTPRWSGEDQVTAAHFIETILAPLLTGQDPCEVERLSVVTGRALFGHPFTKAALEMAMWDILGKAAGLPLYRLLGGKVRDFVPTKWSVSGAEPARAAEIATWAVEQGFRTMKVKVGIDPEQDVERVRAVRDAIGPGVRLGIDANGAWSVRAAIAMVNRLRKFDIYFAEQPTPPGRFQLARRGSQADRRSGDCGRKRLYRARCALDPPGRSRRRALDLCREIGRYRAGAEDRRDRRRRHGRVHGGKQSGDGDRQRGDDPRSVVDAGRDGRRVSLRHHRSAVLHGRSAARAAADYGRASQPHERPGLGVELDEAKVRRYRVT